MSGRGCWWTPPTYSAVVNPGNRLQKSCESRRCPPPFHSSRPPLRRRLLSVAHSFHAGQVRLHFNPDRLLLIDQINFVGCFFFFGFRFFVFFYLELQRNKKQKKRSSSKCFVLLSSVCVSSEENTFFGGENDLGYRVPCVLCVCVCVLRVQQCPSSSLGME